MRQGLRIVWNACTNYAREGVLIVLALALNPFLFHRLGEDAYGVIALTGTTAGFLYLLDVGMGHAVARFVSRYVTLDDPRKVGMVVSTAAGIYLVIGVIAGGIVAVVGLFWLPALGVPESVLEPGRWVMVLMGVGLAIRFFCYGFEGALRGVQRFDLSNAAYISERLLFATLVVLAIGVWRRGLLAAGVCLFVAGVAENLIRLVAAFRAYRPLQVRPSLVSLSLAKEMFRFGLLASLTQISSFLEKTGTRLLVSVFLSSTVLGFFNLVMVAVMALLRLATAVNIVVMPVASKLEVLEDRAQLARLLFDGSRFVLTLVVPSAAWLMVMAAPLLRTWVGPELVPHAPLLLAMTVIQLIDLLCGVGNMVLVGSGHVKRLGWTYFLTSVAAMLLLLPLLWATDLGLYALVVALGATVLVRRVLVLIDMCRVVQRTVGSYLREVLLPVCGVGLLTALVLAAARQWLPESGWWTLGASVVIGGVVHLAASWIVVLTATERRRALALVAQTAQRFRGATADERNPSC